MHVIVVVVVLPGCLSLLSVTSAAWPVPPLQPAGGERERAEEKKAKKGEEGRREGGSYAKTEVSGEQLACVLEQGAAEEEAAEEGASPATCSPHRAAGSGDLQQAAESYTPPDIALVIHLHKCPGSWRQTAAAAARCPLQHLPYIV